MPDWNEGQQEVLDSLKLDENILVSAAAGSGKTAVMVERIIQTVISGKADIDEILVVTFMKEAASQMRTKIISALEKAAASSTDPEVSARLGKQLALAENADIMTTDSFCNKVVRENFNLVGVDPSFNITQGNETLLLKEAILEKILEQHYRDDDTLKWISSFMMSKNIRDEAIKNLIMKIYDASSGYADQDGWLKAAREDFVSGPDASIEDVYKTNWAVSYVDYLNVIADDFIVLLEESINKIKTDYATKLVSSDVKEKFIFGKLLEIFENDLAVVKSSRNCKSYESKFEAGKAFGNFALTSRAKATEVKKDEVSDYFPDEEKDYYSDIHSRAKGIFGKIPDPAVLKEEVSQQAKFNNCIIDIVEEFKAALIKEKNRLKKYEFNDVAHMAFSILYDLEQKQPTKLGVEKSQEYKYIYVDEYQDSSDIQENLLNAIARRDANGNPKNIFMVGDVKQSIYGFRDAKPEIFVNKSHKYESKDGGTLLTLNMNYRSRSEVLEATNFIFRNVMRSGFGGIEYTDKVALHTPKAEAYLNHYPDSKLNVGGKAELIKISNIEDDEDRLVKSEIVAISIGKRILELINGDEENGIEPFYVLNKKFDPGKPEDETNSRYRRATFGDVVIIQRSLSDAPKMMKIFDQMGIPVHCAKSSGYFDAVEVNTLMSILRVIDNIQQDIPYASVLLSHIGGMNESELVKINGIISNSYISLPDKCRIFVKEYENSEDAELKYIALKIKRINDMLSKWTKLRPFITISDLIELILNDTDYMSFVAAMPDGLRRVEKLEKLGYYAREFEKDSSVGLFDFLQYIDRCLDMEKELDEDGGPNNGNVVNITTIHKTKGLEYPIVFVGQIEKKLVKSEKESGAYVDKNFRIIMDRFRVLDPNGKRLKFVKASNKGEIVKIITDHNNKAEEARLLYVAMTRAEEKLIMVGKESENSVGILDDSNSYMDFCNYAVCHDPIAVEAEKKGIEPNLPIIVTEIDAAELKEGFKKEYIKKNLDYRESFDNLEKKLEETKIEKSKDSDEAEKADNPYSFEYPFSLSARCKSKMSVSEIKHSEMKLHEKERITTDEEGALVGGAGLVAMAEMGELAEIQGVEELVNDFGGSSKSKAESGSRKKRSITSPKLDEAMRKAAKRGTATHLIFEKLDYSMVSSKETLISEMERVLSDNAFDDEDRELIDIEALSAFYSDDASSLFHRMKAAFGKSNLYREQQFMAGLKFEELPGFNNLINDGDKKINVQLDNDYVIIQGIIDAYFIENDDIILVDYKTDNIKSKKELLDKYSAQMYLYGLTLEKLTGKKVADCILYSTKKGEVHYTDWREYLTKNDQNK